MRVYLGGLREYNQLILEKEKFERQKYQARRLKPKIKRPKPKKRLWANYGAFIKSPYWKQRRGIFYKTVAKRECSACNAKNGLDVHHLTYERLGQERNKDLVLLCRNCHKEVHRLHKLHKGSLSKVTMKFISTYPQPF